MGKGCALGEHAATACYGKDGVLHGFKSLVLQNDDGSPAKVYSIASGLDYPAIGPEHAYLKASGRVKYDAVTDEEALKAFYALCKSDGIIPALESAHAVAYALKLAKIMPEDKNILVIDDIMTTGSTMEEISRILIKNGAKNVYALTVAHTKPPKDF